MTIRSPYIILLLAALTSFVLHLPHFHTDVLGMHSWRQAQTQTNVDNFAKEDANIFRPRRNDRGAGDGIFRMEFPLQQWLAAKVQTIAGEGPVVMRSFLFVLSILSVLGLFLWLRAMIGVPDFTALAAGAFAFSPTFFYHGFNPMPDNLALCAGIWALALTEMAIKRKTALPLWALVSVMFAVSTLCKLPFVLYYLVPAVYLLRKVKLSNGLKYVAVPVGILLAGFVAPALWYAYVIPDWQGNNIVGGVFSVDYSWARLFDYFQHNIISTLPEMLLNFATVPVFLYGLYVMLRRGRGAFARYAPYSALALALFAFFFYELHALGKAHDYYLYPYLPILFLLVGYGLRQWWLHFENRRLKYFLPALLLLAPVFCSLRLANAWDPTKPGFNPDLYAYRADLRAAVPDSALVVVAIDQSPFIYLYHLRKKGWVLHDNEPSSEDIRAMLAAGAQYLYSDSRQLEDKAAIRTKLGPEVMRRGSFRVFRLRPGDHESQH